MISSFLKTSISMILMVMFTSCGHHDIQKEVKQAVEALMHKYPESTLQDIYKSFFQDEYGPGHLLSDTGAAKRYLEHELSAMTSRGNYQAEPCGTGKKFMRVPLDLVKDHIIPLDDFLQAFMESASSFKTPEIDIWRMKWEKIEKIIDEMNLNLPNIHTDKSALEEMMKKGEFVVHHSGVYTRTYDPHYRIMGRDQWKALSIKYLQ